MSTEQEKYLQKLLSLKVEGHKRLDEYVGWTSGNKNEVKHDAYVLMAEILGVPEHLAHFSMMNRHEEVMKAISVLKFMTGKRKKERGEASQKAKLDALLTPQVFTHESTLSIIDNVDNNHTEPNTTMAREASFTFIPESQLTSTRTGSGHTATVNGKYGYLRLSNEYIRDHKLEGKLIKMYADKSKNAIGWKVMDSEKSFDSLKEYRMIKMYKKKVGKTTTETSSLGVGSLLKALGVKNTVYKKLPIKSYKESGMLSDEFNYIQLV